MAILGCPHTAAALYGFAENLNAPIFGIPAAGIQVLQMESTIEDFPLFTSFAYSYADLTRFITGFLYTNNYYHLTVFRDDSYAMFAVMTEVFMRFIQEHDIPMYTNTVIAAVRSKKAMISVYKQLLRNSNERSRGG